MKTMGGNLNSKCCVLLALAMLAAGCARMDSTIVGHYPGPLALQDWRTIASANQPQRGEIVRIVDAGRSDSLSNHFVIIRSRELPHRHLRHDSTVVVLEGQGTMTIGKEVKKVRPGAVIFIPRGTVHGFQNDGDRPAVALVVYAPPFDGQDREIVRPGGGEERGRPGPADLRKGGGPEPPRPQGSEETEEPDALPGRPLSSPGAVPERDEPAPY